MVEGEQGMTVQAIRKRMIITADKLEVFRVPKDSEERGRKARIERDEGGSKSRRRG